MHTNDVNKYKYKFDFEYNNKRANTIIEPQTNGIDKPKAAWKGNAWSIIIEGSIAQWIDNEETTNWVNEATRNNITAIER